MANSSKFRKDLKNMKKHIRVLRVDEKVIEHGSKNSDLGAPRSGTIVLGLPSHVAPQGPPRLSSFKFSHTLQTTIEPIILQVNSKAKQLSDSSSPPTSSHAHGLETQNKKIKGQCIPQFPNNKNSAPPPLSQRKLIVENGGVVAHHFANYNTPENRAYGSRPKQDLSSARRNYEPVWPPSKKDRNAKLPVTPLLNHDDANSEPRARFLDTPGKLSADSQKSLFHIATSPTCSLNLVCYRSGPGAQGCILRQIQTVLKSRYTDEADFKKALSEQPALISTDVEFFETLSKEYLSYMCGFWRRCFSLKTLCAFRLLEFTPETRPTVVPLDEFALQEVLYAFHSPSKINTSHDWIDWVFPLRQVDRRHALEFVEGWNGTRIAVAGICPLLFSTIVGIVWSVRSGDVQTAFTVAGFILTAGTLMLALLAVLSGIESSQTIGNR